MSTENKSPRLDLSKSQYDLSTFTGRAYHFFNVTDPRTILCSTEELEAAKILVQQYSTGNEPAGTTKEQLLRAQKVYDSAYHPQTGQLNFFMGRMSFQLPGNMLITAGMCTFFRTTPAVVFWQFTNQSFNAIVNYTNRNASTETGSQAIATSYAVATTAATATALSLNAIVKKLPSLSNGIVGRLVPFAAVAAANIINIPVTRRGELENGIDLLDNNNNPLLNKAGEPIRSKDAAQNAIRNVVASRILMAVPGMVLPPMVMSALDKRGFLKRHPRMEFPLTLVMAGICLAFATPLGCAVFPQTSSLPVDALDVPTRTALAESGHGGQKFVYFNKGL